MSMTPLRNLATDVVAAIDSLHADPEHAWSYEPMDHVEDGPDADDGLWTGDCERVTFGAAMADFTWTDGHDPHRSRAVVMMPVNRGIAATITVTGVDGDILVTWCKGFVNVRMRAGRQYIQMER